MKIIIALVMTISTIQLFAGICKWTGNAGDGKWSSTLNWSSVPTASDEVEFDPGNSSLTVTLDQSGLTTVSIIRVKSGIVTLNADSGALVRTTGSNTSGLDVAAGAELVMAAPLDLNARFNKSGLGTVRFQSSLTSSGGSLTSYFGDGKVIMEGSANLSFDGTLGLGLGRDAHVSVVLNDSARLRVGNTIATGHNDNKSASADIIVDGANATLVAWKLYLGSNTAPVDPDVIHGMIVSNGTVNLTTFLVGNTSSASYVQEGGLVSVATFTVKDDADLSASFVLKGGTFTYNNAAASIPDYWYAEFAMHGGTLAATQGLTVDKALELSGDVAFEVPANKVIVFEKSPILIDGTTFRKKGEGRLLVKKDLVARGSLAVEAGELCFDAGVTVTNPDGVYTPYPISVSADATLRLEAVTTRFSLPLSLTLDGTVAMSEGENGYVCRSVLVSHKRTGKGRIAASAANHLTGGAGSSIVVPWIWTGAAGDNLWSNQGNWDNGIVPESRSTTIVDVSAATAPIVLDSNVNLGGIVSMPGAGRVRTITGTGAINFVVNSSYQCCGYVQEGSELVMDVGLDKEKANYLTILGGGRFIAKKGYPTLNGNVPPFSLDATVVLAGDFGSTTDMYLGALSHRREGEGHVIFDSGANVRFKNLFVSADVGEYPIKSFRQVDGAVTGDQMYITLCSSENCTPDPFAYILDGGTMSMWAVKLGAQYTAAYPNIIPGGSFIMNRGTATINGLTSWQNQNYFRLNGGDLYCKTFAVSTLAQSVVGTGRIDQNAVSYELGAVTLHPKDASGLTISADVTLTGIGGNTHVCCDNGNSVVFASGTRLDGVSGIEKSGTGTLYFNGETAFAGALVVNAGSVVFDAGGVLDGISSFNVTNSAAAIAVNGTVTTAPALIELAAASCLSLASGKTMTVRRLVVGGVEYAEGAYGFGSGTVVVAKAGDGLWIGADGASWSENGNWASGSAPAVGSAVDFGAAVLVSSATINIEEPVSLSSLAYAYPGLQGGSLALVGTLPLSIADGGVIRVEEGDTLVLSVPLVVAGVLRKTGGGTLVLSGGLLCAGDGMVYAQSGEIKVACTVSGVKIAVSGNSDTPRVAICDGACLSDELVVLSSESCAQSAVVRLEGGTITGSASGEFVRMPITLELNGTTVFAQTDAAVSMKIATEVKGIGTIAQQGTGTLSVSGRIGSISLSLLGGELILGAETAASMDGTGLFYHAKSAGSSLVFDFTGAAQVQKLRIRNRGKQDGFYDAELGLVNELDPLRGYLHVLKNSAAGATIIIR